MSNVIVLGGGVCGLATGLMLARDGHRVTVLERDPAPPPASPEDAWAWERHGVAQFNQAHILQARGSAVLDAELPDVRDALLDSGGLLIDWIRLMPPTITGTSSRPSLRIRSRTSGTSSMCEPDRIDRPTQCTSSATAAATICSGVSRMPW